MKSKTILNLKIMFLTLLIYGNERKRYFWIFQSHFQCDIFNFIYFNDISWFFCGLKQNRLRCNKRLKKNKELQRTSNLAAFSVMFITSFNTFKLFQYCFIQIKLWRVYNFFQGKDFIIFEICTAFKGTSVYTLDWLSCWKKKYAENWMYNKILENNLNLKYFVNKQKYLKTLMQNPVEN